MSEAQLQILDLKNYMESEIIGQSVLIERMLIAMLANGHLLVEGAPGLASMSLAISVFFCLATDILYRVCILIKSSGLMPSAASTISAKSVVTGRFPFSISFS